MNNTLIKYVLKKKKCFKTNLEFSGSCDFFSINHYTTFLVSAGEEGPNPSIDRDSGAVVSFDPSWQPTNGFVKVSLL